MNNFDDNNLKNESINGKIDHYIKLYNEINSTYKIIEKYKYKDYEFTFHDNKKFRKS
jgi:hypothetical protein